MGYTSGMLHAVQNPGAAAAQACTKSACGVALAGKAPVGLQDDSCKQATFEPLSCAWIGRYLSTAARTMPGCIVSVG